MLHPIAFLSTKTSDEWYAQHKGEQAVAQGAFADEDHLSADLDQRAHAERAQGGDPCAVVYLKHLNGKCPGELGGVSQTEADFFLRMGAVRPATDTEILAWMAQGCADEPGEPAEEQGEQLTPAVENYLRCKLRNKGPRALSVK